MENELDKLYRQKATVMSVIWLLIIIIAALSLVTAILYTNRSKAPDPYQKAKYEEINRRSELLVRSDTTMTPEDALQEAIQSVYEDSINHKPLLIQNNK